VPPATFRNPFERTSQTLHAADPETPTALLVVAVIPARYGSTRLTGKPLVEISGRPMIEHVYRRVAEAPGVDAVVVATDDTRIAEAVESFGGVVRMTHAGHETGTDRVAEISRDLSCSIVVNVQGDLPLVEPELIGQVVEPLVADASLPMATICCPLANDLEYTNPNVVKVIRTTGGDAIYFSRSPIPYFRDSRGDAAPREAGDADLRSPAMKHIGLYGFRRDFLLTFATLPKTPLERAESLEQLRAIEHGFRIRVVETQYESVEVDTPEDLERARRMAAGSTAGAVR
jgi:3-deoxy-manno-octulosonate cytidylyltransferase (CMP-KDO synthetase)